MYSGLRLAVAVVFPALAFLSPAIGNRVGLSTLWQALLFASFILVGFAVSAEHRPRCQGRTKRDLLCRRTVNVGDAFCFQHQFGLRAKFRALCRNRTYSFVASNLIATVVAIVLHFAPVTPVVAQPAAPSGLHAEVVN